MFKKVAVVIGALWIIIITVWIALSVVLLTRTDEIGKFLILQVNKLQSGELVVGKISISPLFQFPRISVILNDVSYFEHKRTEQNNSQKPIATIQQFYCGLEVRKLFKGEFKISAIDIDGGELDLIIYPDSSVNLINALAKESTSLKEKQIGQTEKESPAKETPLIIEKLNVNNIRLKITNNPDKRESSILLKNLDSDLDIDGNQVRLEFITSILIEKLKINDNNFIRDQQIEIEAISRINKDKGLQVENGKLEVANSTFNFSGYFNPSSEGELSVEIVSDGSLSILSSLLNENAVKNLRKGKFYFQGTIEGKIFSEFPLIKLNFGFDDVELTNPKTNRAIKNINLRGKFYSGKNKNLSSASVKIDTLSAELQNGQLNLSGYLNDFSQPEYDFNLLLNADVSGLEQIFKLNEIDSLKGNIKIEDRTKGKYDSTQKRFINDVNVSNIVLNDFGFVIPGTIRFDEINGTISRNEDRLLLKDLEIKSDDTDFKINGEILNIQYLIFNIEKEIEANVAIESKVFDLPNFLFFDPSIKRDFPYRILDLDLLVNATTSTSKALHFKSFPDISFDIKKLDATAEGFLPPIRINSGLFKVGENVLGFHMDFENFKTNFLDGQLNFTSAYNSSSYQPYYIKGNFEMKDVKISKLLTEEENDSIPEFYNGNLSASMFTELQFASDTTQFKIIKIKNGDFNYSYGEDTIQTKNLNLTSNGIDYNLEKNSNPFATLYVDGNLKAEKLKTAEFVLQDFDFNFSARNGEYSAGTKKPKFFGVNSRGTIKYSLKPFDINPSYKIYADISSFKIQEMMLTFLKDTLIAGNFSLLMDVSMNGKTRNEFFSTMNGEINISGKNLILYGVDADKIIEEFQRTQNFNLVDAGAVLLAGPVGLAVTKGSDFAKILVTNPGQSSAITKMVSNWDVRNGYFYLKDVAASTYKNRVAAKGWINIEKDSLNVSFAVIDDNGCSIFTQNVYGDLNKPTLERVKIVKTILAPVTNLYNGIMGVNCDVFYEGSLPPPK